MVSDPKNVCCQGLGSKRFFFPFFRQTRVKMNDKNGHFCLFDRTLKKDPLQAPKNTKPILKLMAQGEIFNLKVSVCLFLLNGWVLKKSNWAISDLSQKGAICVALN